MPGHDISVTFGDDQYDPALTPGVINAALDGGAQVISEIIGTPQNLAVRSTLNEECVPQLEASSGDPAFGDVAKYPWTMGANLPYDVEWKAYAQHVASEFPDGAKAALFYVNNDAGLSSKEGFEEVAGDLKIDIVDDQTIEATRVRPAHCAAEQHRRPRPRRHRRLPARRPVPRVPQRVGQPEGGPPGLGAARLLDQHVRQPADPRRLR